MPHLPSPPAPRRLTTGHLGAAALAALLLGPLPLLAAECRGLGPVGTPAKLFEVDVASGPVFFLHGETERAGCPSESPTCRAEESLRTGNRVVVGETSGPWSCALHAETGSRRFAGWLPTAALLPVPALESVRATDWAGRWRGDTERTIRITTTRRGTVVLRAADRDIPEDANPQSPTPAGTVMAEFAADRTEARFVVGTDGTTLPDAEGEAARCRMAVQLWGTFLLVQDNARCGGTSFTGLYRRSF